MGKKTGELMEECGGKDEKSEGFDGKVENLGKERVRLVVEWGGEGASREKKGRWVILVE